MTEEFNPVEPDRPPREQGWKKQTEQIIYHLRNRGDHRIGQLLYQALEKHLEEEYSDQMPDRPETPENFNELTDEEQREHLEKVEHFKLQRRAKMIDVLTQIEAPELLDAIQKLDNYGEDR